AFGLAPRLRAAGAEVTVLDTTWQPAADGPSVSNVVRLHDVYAPAHPYMPLRSLCVHHWLSRQRFDHVIFCAPISAAYYATVAQGLGTDHGGTGLWVLAAECHGRFLQRAARFPAGRTDIELDFLERQAVARATGLVVSTAEVGEWMAAAGWTLPARFVLWGVEAPAEALLAVLEPPAEALLAPAAGVRVSVCMPTYNRPDYLREALGSLMAQTCEDFQVVVVDDGSTDPGVAAVLDELRPVFAARGWTALRQDNAGPAVARRTARAAATGTHLLFMDDDNLALPHEIERFVAASRSGADIIACIPGQHSQCDFGPEPAAFLDGLDPAQGSVGVDWTPVGASPALAMLVNCLGDTNSLVRAEVYDALGGHRGTRDFLHEDYDFFVRAMFAGYRLEVLPEVLFLYRRHDGSRVFGEKLFGSLLTALDPFLERIPTDMHPLFLMLRHDWHRRHAAVAEQRRALDAP
ncbi:MAG: hypothetical protein VR70_02430, partial [Rhodospirillaceae bacterium BRH_c57]